MTSTPSANSIPCVDSEVLLSSWLSLQWIVILGSTTNLLPNFWRNKCGSSCWFWIRYASAEMRPSSPPIFGILWIRAMPQTRELLTGNLWPVTYHNFTLLLWFDTGCLTGLFLLVLIADLGYFRTFLGTCCMNWTQVYNNCKIGAELLGKRTLSIQSRSFYQVWSSAILIIQIESCSNVQVAPYWISIALVPVAFVWLVLVHQTLALLLLLQLQMSLLLENVYEMDRKVLLCAWFTLDNFSRGSSSTKYLNSSTHNRRPYFQVPPLSVLGFWDPVEVLISDTNSSNKLKRSIIFEVKFLQTVLRVIW